MTASLVNVFVSSTWLDLQPEREAVEKALQRLRETKFVGMEYFGSRDEDTRQASLDEVDCCQVYIGIFAGRYGSGITEAEYRRAREQGLPCRIYFKDEAHIPPEWWETDPEKAERLARLKEELRQHHTIDHPPFTSPDGLATKVTADLHNWLFDEYLAPRLEKAARGEYPREEAQVLLAAIRDLSALNQALLARLQATGYVIAPIQIHQACQSITDRLACEFIRGQAVIPREQIRAQLDDFLASAVRYSLLLGPSGTGKSVIMAVEAHRLLESGWAALLMRGQTFSLLYLTERVAQDGLGHPVAPDWRQVVVEPWKGKFPEDLQGFALMVDGVDEAAPEQIVPELLKLHDAVGGLPPVCFKVILSCRDLAWERLSQRLPFWQGMESIGQHVSRGVQVIEVTDFAVEELDRALQAIGATELLTPRQPGEWADPHVEAVRELLKHPAAFGVYSDLHTSGDIASIQNLTWSRLMEQHVQRALGKARVRCGIRSEALREQLIGLASLARRQKSRDFHLSTDVVKEALPDLEVDRLDPTQSPYSALAEEGILRESPAPYPRRLIGFRILDAGSYLLSFTLERQAEGKSVEELRDLATEWVREAYDYAPLLDAMLAWIDRLADDPRDPRLLTILDVLVESPAFRTEVIFRLIRPTVVGPLLEAVREKEPHIFYIYREAARALRPSPEALEEIRCHLNDRNPQARQLAAQLVGTHRDTKSISTLIELLEDDEDDVRRAAYTAFGQIGRPAVAPLLAVLGDISQSAVCRRRCLDALRAVGFRDDQVSAVLGTCLRDGQLGDTALLRSGLLAAAHLRDMRQTSYAIDALASQDWQVVQAAAKLFAETPDPEAFATLRNALQLWRSPEKDANERPWVLRQLLAALAKIEKPEATEIILKTLKEGLQSSGGLSPVVSIWAADDLGLPAARVLILEDLVRRLEERSPAGLVWHSVRRLGATWQPHHLKALVEETQRVADQSVDLAQRLVDTITQGIRAEGDHPLRDHHAQVSALHTLAKCQTPNFITEASRLLQHAGWSFDLQVCEALWVDGDPQAEEALLRKLEQTASQDQSARLEKSHVIRALGTCGTERGVNAVLAYLRSEPAIPIHLPEEAICPLVRRGELKPSQLIEVVCDPQASSQGRTAGLIALGTLNAPGHKDLFREIIAQAEDTTLKAYATRMLGFAQDSIFVPNLQQLLHRTTDPFVAEQAAEALAWLDARQAVRDIERALEEFAETDRASGFVIALAHFREPSSTPVLIDTLERNRSLHVYHEVIEALGAFLTDPRARQIVLERLETWRGGNIDMGEQCPAIRALARHDPQFLLQRVCQLYDAGRLDRSGREELALLIPHLTQAEGADGAALLELLKRLVCDHYLPVREQVAQVLGCVGVALCQQVYEELRDAPDEWSQACAVYSLGFWNSDETKIQSAHYADAFLIRHAADAASEMRHRRHALQQLVEQYKSADGVARLAAYLSIKEHGDEQTIWALRETVREDDLAHTFLRQLIDDVSKRLRDERRKRWDEEQELLASAGTIRFD